MARYIAMISCSTVGKYPEIKKKKGRGGGLVRETTGRRRGDEAREGPHWGGDAVRLIHSFIYSSF